MNKLNTLADFKRALQAEGVKLETLTLAYGFTMGNTQDRDRGRGSVMKVKCLKQEIDSWSRIIEIEVEGVTYKAIFGWDSWGGYELTFQDANEKEIEWPKWAEDYDNATRDLHSDLDRMSADEREGK
jgi:hypothetical protein